MEDRVEEVIKIFKQIQSTSNTNEKKAIIAANKDNELFKRCLVFLPVSYTHLFVHCMMITIFWLVRYLVKQV